MATIGDGKGAKLDLFGDKELNRFFDKSLKFSQQRSILISSYRIAAKPLVSDVKQSLLSRTHAKRSGNLYKSVGVKPSSNRSIAALHVGTRKFGNFKGNHGHLINYGTDIRRTKKGVSRGRVKPSYFWSLPLRQDTQIVQQGMNDNLVLVLDKFVDRNLKKLNKK